MVPIHAHEKPKCTWEGIKEAVSGSTCSSYNSCAPLHTTINFPTFAAVLRIFNIYLREYHFLVVVRSYHLSCNIHFPLHVVALTMASIENEVLRANNSVFSVAGHDNGMFMDLEYLLGHSDEATGRRKW